MRILQLLAPWLPWVAFLVIAQGSTLRLEIGLMVALALVVLFAVLGWYRGILMWITLGLFVGVTVAVVVFHDTWSPRHFAILANGALAVGSWLGLLIGRPFTLDTARQSVDPAYWDHPVFLRANRQITSAWAAAFTFNTGLAVGQAQQVIPDWLGSVLALAALAGAVAFSYWYPQRVRRASAGGAGG